MIAASFVLSAAAVAAATTNPSYDVACPSELAASAVVVAHAPVGWTGFVPTALPLQDVGVSTGPVEDRATLLGVYRKLPRGAFSVRYGELKEWQERERWILCKYGEGGHVLIAKQLPPEINECTTTFTPDRFGGKTIAVSCR